MQEREAVAVRCKQGEFGQGRVQLVEAHAVGLACLPVLGLGWVWCHRAPPFLGCSTHCKRLILMTDVEPPASLPEPPIKEGEEKKEEAKSRPPKSSLEDELAALLMDTDAIAEGAKDATKTAIRVRRKSKEINASCEAMWEASQDRKGAADLWRLLGRNRRTSKDDANDLSDEALRKVCWSGGHLSHWSAGFVRCARVILVAVPFHPRCLSAAAPSRPYSTHLFFSALSLSYSLPPTTLTCTRSRDPCSHTHRPSTRSTRTRVGPSTRRSSNNRSSRSIRRRPTT